MTFGERFLTAPALFPLRFSGEWWGDEQFVLDLPGGPYRVSGLNAAQRDSLADRYGASGSAGDAAAGITIFRAPESDFREIDTRGWEYSLDFDGTAIAGLRLMARTGEDRAAIWTPAADRESFHGVFENVLRPFLASRLLAAGGLLVHSAAIILDDRALLFAGPSGAGKSTIAGLALAAGHEVLSDDLNAVTSQNGIFTLVPLPFTGDLTRDRLATRAAPLRAILMLEQGTPEGLRAMSRGEAVSLIVRSSPYVNRDPANAHQLLDRAGELARASELAILTFRRDGDVWPILGSPWP